MNVVWSTLFFVVLFALLGWAAWRVSLFWQDYKRKLDFVFLRIRVPKKDSKSDRDKEQDETREISRVLGVGKQLLASLHGLYSSEISQKLSGQEYLSLEILAHGGQIHFLVGCPRQISKVVEKQITSFYPEAVVDALPSWKLFHPGHVQQTASLRGTQSFAYPLRTFEEFTSTDPLSNLLNVLSDSSNEEGESAAVQYMIRPVGDSWHQTVRHTASSLKATKKKGFLGLLWGGTDDDTNASAPDDGGQAERMRKKAEHFGFHTHVRVVVSAEDRPTAKLRLKSIVNAFSTFGIAGGNSFDAVRHSAKALLSHFLWRAFRSDTFWGRRLVLTPPELVTLWHLPHARYNTTPGIAWQNYKIVSVPKNIPKQGLLLGHNVYRGKETPVYMKRDDRFRHFYVIGQTGTGKTTIMLNMILQDLRNKDGFCVIDPHGQLVEDILPHVPKDRVDDVIVFDPSDIERPLGLNMLEAATPEEQEMVALDAMNIMIKLFNEEVFGPRIQDYFRNGCLTLMADPAGGAITDIVRLFTDDDFQQMKVKHVKNPVVKSFWTNQMAKTGAREKAEMIPYFAAKFGAFITNGMMRNIIGQTKSAFDVAKVMDEGKVLLVNLSKGTTGEVNSTLLGLILVQKIQMAALRRQSQAKEDRRDFFLYIDEFQNYVTDSIESILSEARKYRLGLNIAHQYIAQIDQSGKKGGVNLKDAVFGNVGTMACYKISAQDAEVLAKEMEPAFNESDLINMDKYKAVMKLSIDTQPSKPFSLIPENPYVLEGDKKVATAMKQISRLTYGRARKFVEQEIFTRLSV